MREKIPGRVTANGHCEKKYYLYFERPKNAVQEMR
jgi:hypothetical protein